MGVIERYKFLFPVSILFLKCWFLGGLFYWFFLFNISFFLSFFDVFFGLLLFLGGLGLFFSLRLFFRIIFWLRMIFFLRWGASGGRSFFFFRFFYFSFEKT
jgi:hypothetical protein